jgi:hypothetical protein
MRELPVCGRLRIQRDACSCLPAHLAAAGGAGWYLRQVLITSAINVLAATPAVMREMLAPLPDEVVAAPGAGGWSARDVVAHLSLRQRAAIIGRVSAILANPNGTIPDVPEGLMSPASLRDLPFEVVMQEFEQGRVDEDLARARLRGDRTQCVVKLEAEYPLPLPTLMGRAPHGTCSHRFQAQGCYGSHMM